MNATQIDIQSVSKALKETPLRLSSLTAGASEGLLSKRPIKGEWSAVEILAHLRACADVWGASIEAMLADKEPVLSDIHPRKWIKGTNYTKLAFAESFEAFKSQRKKLLKLLDTAAQDDWSRGALIGHRRHTVYSQARRMARHEEAHCAQILEFLQIPMRT